MSLSSRINNWPRQNVSHNLPAEARSILYTDNLSSEISKLTFLSGLHFFRRGKANRTSIHYHVALFILSLSFSLSGCVSLCGALHRSHVRRDSLLTESEQD